MNINAILNPTQDIRLRRRSTTNATARSTNYTAAAATPEPPSNLRKTKGKTAKDAPRYQTGPVKGEVRYPPHNITDPHILKRLEKHNITPALQQIKTMPQTIPYSSDKKEFSSKTARDGFEIFTYGFKLSNMKENEKPFFVMWDYNVGLVRITPFFKCMPGHKKTDPKNAILATPGLLDLCYSITGGAILAQGYWVPYDAARALAKSFCYDIRFALTPLFGPSFANECTLPADPAFKRWNIPRSIIDSCRQQCNNWTTTKTTYGIATPSPSRPSSSRNSPQKLLRDTKGTSNSPRIPFKGEPLRPRDKGVYAPELLEDEEHDQVQVMADIFTALGSGDHSDSADNGDNDDANSTSTSSIEGDIEFDKDYTPPTTATDAGSRAASVEPGWNAINRANYKPTASSNAMTANGETTTYLAPFPFHGQRRDASSPVFPSAKESPKKSKTPAGKKRARDDTETVDEADRDSSGEERKKKKAKVVSEEDAAAAAAIALMSLKNGKM